MKLAEHLRQLRSERRMTQAQVARAIGIPVPTYANWECGGAPNSLEKQRLIAAFYNVSVDELFPNVAYAAKCKRCGATLEGTFRKLYCSDRCRDLDELDRRRRERTESKKSCENCGATLPLERSKYCSDECREAAYNRHKKSDAKPETYDPASGESYAEYQMRRNPKYYKSIYIAPKRKGVGK